MKTETVDESGIIFTEVKIHLKGNNGFKMDLDINNLNELNVFIGTNGVGKTALMKFTWFSALLLQIYQTMTLIKTDNLDKVFEQEVNNNFRYSFGLENSLTGWVTLVQKNGSIFKYQLENGELKTFYIDIVDSNTERSLKNIRPAYFNSKNARMFKDYKRYLDTIKLLDIPHPPLSKEFLEKMHQLYPLYDIMWFELIRATVESFAKNGIRKEVVSQLDLFLERDGAPFAPNYTIVVKEDLPYFVKDGKSKSLHSFSSGQQSMLMMLLIGVR